MREPCVRTRVLVRRHRQYCNTTKHELTLTWRARSLYQRGRVWSTDVVKNITAKTDGTLRWSDPPHAQCSTRNTIAAAGLGALPARGRVCSISQRADLNCGCVMLLSYEEKKNNWRSWSRAVRARAVSAYWCSRHRQYCNTHEHKARGDVESEESVSKRKGMEHGRCKKNYGKNGRDATWSGMRLRSGGSHEKHA